MPTAAELEKQAEQNIAGNNEAAAMKFVDAANQRAVMAVR